MEGKDGSLLAFANAVVRRTARPAQRLFRRDRRRPSGRREWRMRISPSRCGANEGRQSGRDLRICGAYVRSPHPLPLGPRDSARGSHGL